MKCTLRTQTGNPTNPNSDVKLPPETYVIYRTPKVDINPYGVVVIEDSRERAQAGSGLRKVLGANPTVSGRRPGREGHLQIQVEEKRVVLTDLGSSNGSYLDGQRITQPTPVDRPGKYTLAISSLQMELFAAE